MCPKLRNNAQQGYTVDKIWNRFRAGDCWVKCLITCSCYVLAGLISSQVHSTALPSLRVFIINGLGCYVKASFGRYVLEVCLVSLRRSTQPADAGDVVALLAGRFVVVIRSLSYTPNVYFTIAL